VVASLAVGGVFLLVMIAASVRAAIVLPADARIALHFGSVERCYRVPKRAGLVIWPAAGAAALGVLGGIAASSLASDWVPGVRDVLVPAALCVLLGFQAGALVMAARAGGDAVNGDAGQGGGPYHLEGPLTGGTVSGTVRTGRPHEDRQQPGQGDAGPASR
jgi:hypothetical protein